MGKRVLVIGDLHAPAIHPKAFDFCKRIQKEYKTNETVFIGDLLDTHNFSEHIKDPSLPGPLNEVELSRVQMEPFYNHFKKAKVIYGNHCVRFYKKAQKVGLPKEFMKSYSEIIHAPKTWDFDFHHVVDDVLYIHGDGVGSGQSAHVRAMQKYMMSAVIGHTHAHAGVYMYDPKYNPASYFSMNVGCLCDTSSPFFNYAIKYPQSPNLGVGVVVDGKVPTFIPMV